MAVAALLAIGITSVFVFSILVLSVSTAQASSSMSSEWNTVLVVGKFLYSDPPKPDQIFKVHYMVIDGSIEKLGREQIQVSASGNATLEIKFPRNYPYTNEEGVTEPNAENPILFSDSKPYDEPVTLSDTTDCFFVFSIPFSGNKTIGIVWSYLLWTEPYHGDKVPDSCVSQTLVENVSTKKDGTISPLQQVKAGVAPRDVLCPDPNHMLIISMRDKPYCANEPIVTKLRNLWQNNGAVCFEAVKYARWECNLK